MTQPGPSDYRTSEPRPSGEGMAERLGEGVREMGEAARETARDTGDRALSMASEVATAVKTRPYTSLAIAAGLAFAAGALWKLQGRRSHSRLQAWLGQLPEMPDRESLMRRWR